MKRFELIILYTALFIFMDCDIKENSGTIERTMNQNSTNEIELKNAILYSGNVEAYKELSISYLDHTIQEEFMFYAMIMANKYDYPQAYFDVYFYLTEIFSSNINDIDEITANLAIDYLLKAKEKGHDQAKEIVNDFNITSTESSKEQIIKIFKE